ncbi:prepilin-type N-terminal cleavage/methylation domain-containing protein [Neptuniibacter sp.]|uniref:prepilin-type N-terminal cleavage/methylation domain-containing protein n=1 Tax=Neptuniibacter sp. TaxID=1962643 RepID=UPI00262E8B7C|nr:prepilin-type N-terminal cleavage/methylation domain-containing protein [Neptuniibacter sp.]MCP4595116.1 prepilin-type N-terminal cleavage/methylation domain-containing protein [Neptuniibacter sp.]
MICKSIKGRQSGYSLIELSVSIIVIGVIVALIFALVPNSNNLLERDKQEERFEEVSAALKGFILSNNRLPCPDTDGNGTEDCAANAQAGGVPYTTLQLGTQVRNSAGVPLAYGVYRAPSVTNSADADLAVHKNRFDPAFFRYNPAIPDLSDLPPTPVLTNLGNDNGLDFCWALRNAIAAADSANNAHISPTSPLNQAYILAGAGFFDKDGNNLAFDAGNQGGVSGAFESPLKAEDSSYDDAVYSMGFHQLAGELSCHSSIAHVNALVRSADAAEDIRRLAVYYAKFREFAVRVARHNREQAVFGTIVATADLAIAAGTMASAIAAGIESFGAAAAVTIGLATVATGLAIEAEISAIDALSQSAEDVATAESERDFANTASTNATTYATQAASAAIASDQRGFYQ